MSRNRPCRCCGDAEPVTYTGLCGNCSEAVERFIALRRDNLRRLKVDASFLAKRVAGRHA